MKLSYMREYVVLAEVLNFTRAAEQLYITQPALSRHIAIIEKFIDTQLLNRSKHSVSLTPAGKIIYEEFKKILHNIDAAIDKAVMISSGQVGELTIHTPYYYTEDYMEPVIPLFHEKYPNISVNIISCQPSPGYDVMYRGETDIVLLPHHEYPNSENIYFFNFSSEKICVVMSANHDLADQENIILTELHKELFIFLNHNYFSEYVKQLLITRQFAPKKIAGSDHIDTLNLTIMQTNGICIMPYHVKNMNRGNLRFIPIQDLPTLPMSLAYRRDNYNPCIQPFLKTFSMVYPKSKLTLSSDKKRKLSQKCSSSYDKQISYYYKRGVTLHS